MYKFLPALLVAIIFSFLISGSSSLSILVTENIVTSGCMDKNACNYNKDAINPNRSCIYPMQNYDCFGNCEVEFDACGVCGGTVFPIINGRDYPPFDRGVFCDCDEKISQCNCPDQCCNNNDCSNETVCLGPKEGKGKIMFWAQFICVNNLCQMEPTGYSNSSAASCYECEFPNFEDRCGVCGGDNSCNENSEDFKKNIIIANYISSNLINIVFGVILITMSLVFFS